MSQTNKILRPNPDFEQDLENHTIVTSEMKERIDSYTAPFKKVKKRVPCVCKKKTSPGIAPMIKLNDGKMMPAFGLGTFVPDKKDERLWPLNTSVFDAVSFAIDNGYRQIDTAMIYGTEMQVGKAVNAKIADGTITRKDVFIVTKLWNDSHAKDAVVPALKTSLKKLAMDYVDLYLIHWPVGIDKEGNFDITDYLETWKGMMMARDLALTRSIGVSNFTEHMIDRIIAANPVKPAVLQVEVNMTLQQSALISYCKEQSVAVQAYTPFGALFPSRAPKGSPPPRVYNQMLVQIAEKHNKTVPQVVLRYLVELGVVPIPKSFVREHIVENIAIFDFQLTHKEKQYLKMYDANYRMISSLQWADSPYYPFDKDVCRSQTEEAFEKNRIPISTIEKPD